MPQFVVEESPQALNVVMYGAGIIGVAISKADPAVAQRVCDRSNARLAALREPNSSLRQAMARDPELREQYSAWMRVAGIE
jgi:hypothetical protein